MKILYNLLTSQGITEFTKNMSLYTNLITS